jgi:hypothetical protein
LVKRGANKEKVTSLIEGLKDEYTAKLKARQEKRRKQAVEHSVRF